MMHVWMGQKCAWHWRPFLVCWPALSPFSLIPKEAGVLLALATGVGRIWLGEILALLLLQLFSAWLAKLWIATPPTSFSFCLLFLSTLFQFSLLRDTEVNLTPRPAILKTDANGGARCVWHPPGRSSSVAHNDQKSLFNKEQPTPFTSTHKGITVIQLLIVLNVYAEDPWGDSAECLIDHYRVIKLDISKEFGEKPTGLW